MSAIASVAPLGPAVIASQRTHGDFDTSQTTSASEQKLAHILVIAQEYNLCAWLFHIPLGPDYRFLGKDAKGRLPCEKGLEDCLTPGPLARFFTRRVVGTAKVAGVSFNFEEHSLLLTIRCFRLPARILVYQRLWVQEQVSETSAKTLALARGFRASGASWMTWSPAPVKSLTLLASTSPILECRLVRPLS